jgi:hypothetical protein
MMSKAQKNSLDQLRGTLDHLASPERQIAYKKAVPFVHVPAELFAQWDNHARMLREVDWFRVLFSEEDRAAIGAFGAKVERFRTRQGAHFPDVDEILADPEWHAVGRAAGELRDLLQVALGG